MVIADTLSTLVDSVYDQPTRYNGISFAVATVFFAFQIYCDFSGYSDIAIGAAQIIGYRTMEILIGPIFRNRSQSFGEDGTSPFPHGLGTISISP